MELILRYLRGLDLRRRADQMLAAAGVCSDYGSGRVLLLVLALLVVGARRLEHLQYIGGDPLVGRLCGLRRLPTARTVANWLKQFTQRGVQALRTLNRELLGAHLRRLRLPRSHDRCRRHRDPHRRPGRVGGAPTASVEP